MQLQCLGTLKLQCPQTNTLVACYGHEHCIEQFLLVACLAFLYSLYTFVVHVAILGHASLRAAPQQHLCMQYTAARNIHDMHQLSGDRISKCSLYATYMLSQHRRYTIYIFLAF